MQFDYFADGLNMKIINNKVKPMKVRHQGY